MTTTELIAACRALRELRDEMAVTEAHAETLAADIRAELQRRRVDSFDFAPDRRAVLVRTPHYEVVDARIEALIARGDVKRSDLQAALRVNWDKRALKSLLGDDYHEILDTTWSEPRLQIRPITAVETSAQPVDL